MLIKIKDADGIDQLVTVRGAESIVDKSGVIAVTSLSQTAIAANPLRSGFFFQNNGSNNMWLSELADATNDSPSIKIIPGEKFSSFSYPLISSNIRVIGTVGDKYTAREW